MDELQELIQNLKLARINSEIAEADLNDVLRELATRIEHLQKALEARNV